LRPGDTAHMLIFADDGLLSPHVGEGPADHRWDVMKSSEWTPLQDKYGLMMDAYFAAMERSRASAFFCGPEDISAPDAWVVWDDDDVYLSWHLAAHAEALQVSAWSHPSRAYSTYQTDPLTEAPREKRLGGSHYHGALAIRADLMRELGGWPTTDRSDYDKQMLAACRRQAGPPADPCAAYAPSYVYRWQDTGKDHVSGRSQVGADGVRRYRPPRIQEPAIDCLTPLLDASAAAILSHLDDDCPC
jgi:hypothetical protein